MKHEKFIEYLSWTATAMSILMYVSYIPQIIDNLSGSKGNPVQPLVAAVNCGLWVLYGLIKEDRDIPLATANFPGIIFGFVTFLTAI
ncbi:membrane protein [Leuconostoc gasicomitatum]|uniref:SemiSWEET family transporter n=1 Tax=Leuconostoc TaxID=1243 RepID=UPI0001DB5A65|nr:MULTISPECIES: SemiSWEET family transporter [Leuconostoc]MBZ5943551.1 hypothetical protein [Leuconostoc gasicomitatum]MBZ5948535.1 hypothetical protein [Leuconostoc gasicomitatum]MBZ5950280.1 hypothetical protein [Leuconostoc gasicomitatum]MBZ5952182.1 hypothetical protein [Leuconostoc gasicomitatum]MBZ5952653.1 hypothetical protein [Leuconostoc gasicomitatum]